MVELRGDSVQLLAASPVALQAGVRAGMTATAARSLVPGLALAEHNAAAELADLEALTAALCRLSPRVFTDLPRAILLDITGCERLFGSEAALAAQAAATVERLGFTPQTGLAQNATAACALALSGAARLEDAPIEALRIEASDLRHLSALGLYTIGQLTAQPLESLPSRFSGLMLRRLRELRGDVPEEFPAFIQPEIIVEGLQFEGPTDRHDAMLFALRRLAVALEERLTARAAGALALEVSLRATEGAPVRFAMSLSRPTRESSSLAALLLGRFESVDTGERWFDGVEARVPSVGKVQPPQRDLFAGRDHGAERALAELTDELAGRLGVQAVAQAALTHDPRPERAFNWQPFAQGSEPVKPAAPRPATMFEPHEVSVECDEGGRPVRWQDGSRASGLTAQPVERVHFGWWGGDAGERDYFAVQDDAGARWWLMRRGQGWYIVGAF